MPGVILVERPCGAENSSFMNLGFHHSSLIQRLLPLVLVAALAAGSSLAPGAAQASRGPGITNISTNESQYPRRQVPAYHKLEITFQVATVAQNTQLPYDASPPPGIEPEVGVSVDALFTPDGWRTVYRQPAFLYQEFDHQVKGGREWIYPTGEFAWKVRFAPPAPGIWQFKLAAEDAGGRSESVVHSFRVAPSTSPGFVRVSGRDSRYFEFENGTYFPGLGYNMNFDHLSWTNPRLDNEANLRRMGQNGVQMARIWLSQWGIYGPSWNPWNSIDPAQHSRYVPEAGLSFVRAYPGSDVSMLLTPEYTPCMFQGFMKPSPAVKPHTTYQVRVRHWTEEIAGPVAEGHPFGLVVKTGGWLAGDDRDCVLPGAGQAVTGRVSADSADWQILEGRLETGEQDFLPNLYLAIENASAGKAYIDYVWVQEVEADGELGPNIISKPWMAHHLYMDQRASYAFDQALELAEAYDVTLRLVVMEKLDWIFNRIDFEGQPILDTPECKAGERQGSAERCPHNRWFYGDGRQMTKVRWLQQAWWRHLQARWGYSTSIHSWELLNEGDPASGAHFALADEFGKYMRQFAPNHHMVTTSFWHSFPAQDFWANPGYPHIDYATIHMYADARQPGFADTSAWTFEASLQYGAAGGKGIGKPVVRGETGFVNTQGRAAEQILQDTQGIWLHNLVWGGINPGGLIETYWFENRHIYRQSSDGTFQFDLRPVFRAYYNFIRDIPLNQGRFSDAGAKTSSTALRAWGQQDASTTCTHLWIHNRNHTWQNFVRGKVQPISGEIRLGGLIPGRDYQIEWWDTYQPDLRRQITGVERRTAADDGSLVLAVAELAADVAVKVKVFYPDGSLGCSAARSLPQVQGQPLLMLYPFSP
jgi:hypothetical protein